MKNEITIETGRLKGYRERTFIFKTNEDIDLDYFTTRRTLDYWLFPKDVKWEVEMYTESGGAFWDEKSWKDFENDDWFTEFKIQNIFSISINAVDINQSIINECAKRKVEVKFPLLYHVQFIFPENKEWVFNWYPTTGTLTKQKDDYYSIKKIEGEYLSVNQALDACK
jgi:hypothetical protein